MPDGVVQWIDPPSGRAAVIRGGHVYAAATGDIEPVARHAGAHVHFDIRRGGGGERAVDVRLRPGTRVSHHQRRYGTLTGAHRPDTKGSAPFARPHPQRDRGLASHPLEVARAWVECLQARDLDGALSLYASDAVLHAGDGDHAGRSQLGGWLGASPMFGIDRDPDIKGEDGSVLVAWASRGEGLELRARIEHGLIVEQWVGRAPPMGRAVEVEGAGGPVVVTVLTRGPVGDDDIDYAVGRVGAVVRHIEDPVLFARLKLARAGDPARARPALAQVALDVNGELVRAHVAGHTVREAADLLQRRLADKLDHRAQHREALRTRTAEREAGEWRHGDLPTEQPDYYERPREERQLVRHKTFAVDELTVDEAAFDMEQLDYDFHLFRDLASGQDAVLERTAGGGYRLTRLHLAAAAAGPASIDLAVADAAPAVLTVAEAIERLDADGERFVFFANPATGRGNVIYRRYDGHYGLITPADAMTFSGGDTRGDT
jgi:hypothetical protein